MAEERMIFRCEDSVDGIFTAIYKAWEYGTSRSSVEINICATMKLFVQYADVEADYAPCNVPLSVHAAKAHHARGDVARIACARGILEKLQVAIGKGGCLTRDEG